MWAWILPPAALLVGVGLVAIVLRRSVRVREKLSAPLSMAERPLSSDQEARLRSAIREIEMSEDPSF
jgi:hypothetical protein